MLLDRVRREEENSLQEKFIRECRIHPVFLVLLANDLQLQELEHFCANHSEFCVFSVDPSFNVFKDKISLTVTLYKDLKLAQMKTGNPQVFIGPALLHQNSKWKTFSKFAHYLITEQLSLAGIQGCGSDGEKVSTDGFKGNFQFAFGLRCFIDFKKNIEKELSERKFNGLSKNDFMVEIFGKKEGELKYSDWWTVRLVKNFMKNCKHQNSNSANVKRA